MFKDNKSLIYNLLVKKKNVVLTPHSGEFERLFKIKSNSKILKCLNASKKIGNTILFKGNDTVIGFKDKYLDNDNAENSLATAGTGDVLCGLISGFTV